MKLLFSAENVRFFALVFFCADWFWNLRMTEARRHVAVDGGRNFYRLASRFPLGSVCQKITYNVRIWIPFAISNQNSPGFLMGYNVPVFFLDKRILAWRNRTVGALWNVLGVLIYLGIFILQKIQKRIESSKKLPKKNFKSGVLGTIILQKF